MEILQTQFESILKTLPIGYYFGRNVPVEATQKETSFCDLESETIFISYPAVRNSLAKVKEYNPEKQIRAHMYHELSHLILTPVDLYSHVQSSDVDIPHYRDVLNIFEDERIESVLRNYYHDVDFWESVNLENDPVDLKDPDLTPIERFFAAVRLHQYPSKTAKQSAMKLIQNSWTLAKTATTSEKSCYVDNVMTFYRMHFLRDDPARKSIEIKMSGSQDGSSSESGEPTTHSPDSATSGSSEVTVKPIPVEDNPLTSVTMSDITEMVKFAARTLTTNPAASDIKGKFKRIIQTAMNKHANQSASQNGYAGRINPRLAGNRDYRWFTRQNSKGSGGNRYSKIKINLFVDKSGSFASSQKQINAVLIALRELHDEMPDFLFDVATMGMNNNRMPATHRCVECRGGNALTHEIFDIYDQMQDPRARCINIAVFDGNAWSDVPYDKRPYEEESIGAFNHPNCILISDNDNARPIAEHVTQAKTVILNRSYADKFINEILSSLERLLA